MGRPYLSVVIPCYNEIVNLQKGVLSKVAEFLGKQKYLWEVIVVDDGSTDESPKFLEKFIKDHPHFSLKKNPHQGKAATVISGLLAARGDWVLFCDMDQATPIEEVEKFSPYFKTYDLVIGSRNSQRKGAPPSRILMARGFMFLRNLILGLRITDTQCGFKAFKQEVVHNLCKNLKIYGQKPGQVKGSIVTAGFDVEMLFLAKKMGYKIAEVPIEWRYVETRRVGIIKDSWQGFWDMVKIRFNNFRGLYKN